MKTQTTNYQGHSVRYTVVSDNGILMNTADICRALGITVRPPGSDLSAPCMDIKSVIKAALAEGKNEMEFVERLEKKFTGYEMQTPIRPNCDDNWKLK